MGGMESGMVYAWGDVLGIHRHVRRCFLAQEAGIQLSGDDVLVPCLQVGVEARTQVAAARGWVTNSSRELISY